MRAMTQLQVQQKMIGRAIVDRKRKTETSLLVEQRAINEEFGTPLSPAVLYSYYISVCQTTTWDLLADNKVAKQLGSTARAVADNRRKLQKAGWIKFLKHTYKGIEYGTWYIGKEVVKAELDSSTSLDTLNTLGLITDEEYQLYTELERVEYE